MINHIAIQENIAHISILAGAMLQEGTLDIDDSVEFVSNIILWAKQFENTQEEYDDYLSAIDEFATAKLNEHYGVKDETAVDSGYKPLFLQSFVAGVTMDQYERYGKFVEQSAENELDYIPDIQEFLDENEEVFQCWAEEEVTYEELFACEVLTGQNGVYINDKLRDCFNDGIDMFDAYNF